MDVPSNQDLRRRADATGVHVRRDRGGDAAAQVEPAPPPSLRPQARTCMNNADQLEFGGNQIVLLWLIRHRTLSL